MDRPRYSVIEWLGCWYIGEDIGDILYYPKSIPFDTEKEARDALFLDRTGDTWKRR